MSSLNKAIILGRLGKDVELRSTQGGKSVSNLAVATEHSYSDQTGQVHKQTEWHSVVIWGKTAENCAKYLAKGSQVLVEGRLQSSKYKDKEGVERYKTEIVAENVQFVGSRREAAEPATAPTPGPAEAVMSDQEFLDSMPF